MKIGKTIILTTCIALFAISTGFAILFISAIALDEKTDKEMAKIIEAVQSYVSANNSYPENFENFVKNNNLKTDLTHFFFSTKIKFFQNNGTLKVEYYHFPFGPFTGYNFETNEWYSEE